MGLKFEPVKKFTGVFTYTSTTKRHKGRPDVCFYVTLKVNGKKERHKIGWRSDGVDAAYAAAKRTELLNQTRLGEQPRVKPRKDLVLGAAWRLFYDNHCLTNQKHPEKTRSRWRSLVRDYLQDVTLSDITPLRLEEYKRTLQELGKSPKTIEHALALIRAIFRKMIAWDKYSGKVPTSDVIWPKYDNRRERWFEPGEAAKLMAEIKSRSVSFYRVCMVSLHTGMRFGEVAALQGEHVNLAAGTIRVQDTKGGRDRTVFITAQLKREAFEPIEKRPGVFDEVELRPGRLVFPARGGGKRTEPSDSFRRAVDELKLNRGIRDNRNRAVFHTLRHTFGSWLAISGVPLYWIAKLMGHTNEEVTERYSHLCPDVQRQAVDVIDAAYGAGKVIPGQWFSSSGS